MREKQLTPWISRTCPAWGYSLIDSILSESRIAGHSAIANRGEIPGVRFWHLLVGDNDFALGGGRYVQVLKSINPRPARARKSPLCLRRSGERIESLQNNDDRPTVRISCASVMGFLSLLRVEETEHARRKDVELPIGGDGGPGLRFWNPLSNADRYNECHLRARHATDRPNTPVKVSRGVWEPNTALTWAIRPC